LWVDISASVFRGNFDLMENHVYFKSAVDNVAVDEGLVPYVCI
jgi:hypothetical protein